jgi:hypothetical protein
MGKRHPASKQTSITMLIMRMAGAKSCFRPAPGNVMSYTHGDFESDGTADHEQ